LFLKTTGKILRLKPKTLHRTLPLATFEAVYQLLQQMAELPGAIWLASESIAFVENLGESPSEKFAVVVSDRFSALLRGKPLYELGTNAQKSSAAIHNSKLNVELTFEPGAIANFLSPLPDKLSQITPASSLPIDMIALKQGMKNIQPNSPELQSEFTLSLLEIIGFQGSANSRNPLAKNPGKIGEKFSQKFRDSETLEINSTDRVTEFPMANSCVSLCQPVEDALQQQLAQERLLNQVTTQIRTSLELPVILSKAVEQVREFLDVDRLLIYQFEKLPVSAEGELRKGSLASLSQSEEIPKNPGHSLYLGRVTYEALASNAISSVLNFTEGAQCLPHGVMQREKYRKGLTFAIADVEKTYSSQPCFLELMRRAKVRAKLVVPIVVQEELWGLLIAHHSTCREWEESKKTFLRQIAEHLAIAIYQAELYAEVQQQKRTLEQRVIEGTRELRDALGASQQASPRANFWQL